MKKVLVGCLGVILLVVVAAGIGGYYFIYRPARTYLASFQQLGEIPQIERQVKNQAPFSAPESGELTSAQVDGFMSVAGQIQARLGGRADELKAKYDEFDRARQGEGGDASVSQVLGAFRDLASFFVEGKRAQVEALNQVGFSLDEYTWVKERVFAAAGMVLTQIDVTELSRAAGGEVPDLDAKRTELDEEVPEQNRALVQPHIAKLREYLTLGFFGL